MTELSQAAPAKKTHRKRDPQGTHELILAAARELLAKDGEKGLSVEQVVQRAGVNRSTAYQHFQTREQLIEATAASVGDSLCQAVFGVNGEQPRNDLPVDDVAAQFVEFAMENPELGSVWLMERLRSSQPANDRFFRMYVAQLQEFAKSDNAQPGIDAEVHAVLMLSATFIWPLWVRARTRTAKERQQMAKRFTRAMLTLSLHGIHKPAKS